MAKVLYYILSIMPQYLEYIDNLENFFDNVSLRGYEFFKDEFVNHIVVRPESKYKVMVVLGDKNPLG